ncbi:MAG: glyoxalase superfamily protein [Chitinophagaceae bacterium]
MKFDKATPILYSADVAASLAFYTGVLEFERKWGWEEPPTFGGVSKDCVEVFFCEKGQGSPGTWLSVFVDNVDEYYERIKAKGAKILCPPGDMEWNVREMLVEDPDGHKIRFGHSIESEKD